MGVLKVLGVCLTSTSVKLFSVMLWTSGNILWRGEPPVFVWFLWSVLCKKSAECLKVPMWEHSRRSSTGFTLSEWRWWKNKKTKFMQIGQDKKVVPYCICRRPKMSRELLLLWADVSVNDLQTHDLCSRVYMLHPASSPLTWTLRRFLCCFDRWRRCCCVKDKL